VYAYKPKPIAELVSEFVSNYTDQQSVMRGVVLHRWRDVVGPMIADQCQSIRFDSKNRLVLSVPQSSWRHEINMQRTQIRELLNKEAGGDIISEIIVRA
jgi:predicted nucleic acid-binding Zn ribbon protein